MPWLVAIEATSVPAARTALHPGGGDPQVDSLPGTGVPRVVIAGSRFTIARAARRRIAEIGPSAVAGRASRARTGASKFTSPANASVIGCRAAAGADGAAAVTPAPLTAVPS